MVIPLDLDHSIQHRQLVSQGECTTLWYYAELRIIHHQISAPPSSQEFRELLTRGADVLERFHVQKWLSDDSGNNLIRPDDETWARNEWLPRALRGGFKYWAIVRPSTAVGKLLMHRLAAEHAQIGIVSHFGATPDDALEWLMLQ